MSRAGRQDGGREGGSWPRSSRKQDGSLTSARQSAMTARRSRSWMSRSRMERTRYHRVAPTKATISPLRQHSAHTSIKGRERRIRPPGQPGVQGSVRLAALTQLEAGLVDELPRALNADPVSGRDLRTAEPRGVQEKHPGACADGSSRGLRRCDQRPYGQSARHPRSTTRSRRSPPDRGLPEARVGGAARPPESRRSRARRRSTPGGSVNCRAAGSRQSRTRR